MKKLLLNIIFLFLLNFTNAQNIDIPDANFKNALISLGVDKNNDGEVSFNECSVVKDLDVSDRFIANLKGIEAFINLNKLKCSSNLLAFLDVSECKTIKSLDCNGNQLKSLDLSKNIELNELFCTFNQLTNLDLSNNTALVFLACFDNPISNLELSNNNLLEDLRCGSENLVSLNVSKNAALLRLQCGGSQLNSLDISNNKLLTWLDCPGCQLTNLIVPKHSALTELNCSNNKLTSLDLSGCDSLKYLNCQMNKLTNLDLTGCYSLKVLDSGGNQFSSLDMSDCENLGSINLQDMPNLYQVCVWELPFNSWKVVKDGSPNINFSIECWKQDNLIIPDKNFKNALRIPEIDTNNNRKISYSEAEAVTSLDVSGKNISSLTGIEAFINLKVLDCSNNWLIYLNVKNCTLLTSLSCGGNRLTGLNLSKNINLLSCEGNNCNTILNLSNMPTLYGVRVWEMPFPPADKIANIDTTDSPNVYFSTDSILVNNKGINKEDISIHIFPNPCDKIINIEINNINNGRLEIYDINSKLIYQEVIQTKSNTIDVSNYTSGLYFVLVKQNGSSIIEKLIVH